MGVEMRGSPGHINRVQWTIIISITATVLLLLQVWTSSARSNLLQEQLIKETSITTQCREDYRLLHDKSDTCHEKLNTCHHETENLQQTLRDARDDRADVLKQSDNNKHDFTRCTAELNSLKQVDLTRTNTINSLRLEKDTLAEKLEEAKKKIKSLEDKLLEKEKSPSVTSKVLAAAEIKKEESADPAPLEHIDAGPADGGDHENAANEDMGDSDTGDLGIPRPDV